MAGWGRFYAPQSLRLCGCDLQFSTAVILILCQSQTDERILKVRDFAELRFFFSIKCIESVSYYTFVLRNPELSGLTLR